MGPALSLGLLGSPLRRGVWLHSTCFLLRPEPLRVPFLFGPRKTKQNRNKLVCEQLVGVSQAFALSEGNSVRDVGVFWEI